MLFYCINIIIIFDNRLKSVGSFKIRLMQRRRLSKRNGGNSSKRRLDKTNHQLKVNSHQHSHRARSNRLLPPQPPQRSSHQRHRPQTMRRGWHHPIHPHQDHQHQPHQYWQLVWNENIICAIIITIAMYINGIRLWLRVYNYDPNTGTAVTAGTITTRTAVQPAGATVVAAVSGGNSSGGSGRATPSTPTAPATPSTPTQRIIVTPSTQTGVSSATVVWPSLLLLLHQCLWRVSLYIYIF